MNMLAIIIIVLVIVFAVFLFIVTQSSDRLDTPPIGAQAEKIAWAELKRHYKNGEFNGEKYKLKNTSVSQENASIYYFTFDLERTIDMTVWITVDEAQEKVIEYKKAEA